MKLLKTFFIIVLTLLSFSNSFSQWTKVIDFPTLRVAAMAKCGNKYYAGTSTGILNIGQIYCSNDNGLSWTLVNTGFNISGVFSMAVRDNYIYVGTYESGLLMSSDDGQSWTLNDMGIWKLGVFGVGVSGDNNVYAYINSGSGQKLSTDKGVIWNPLPINSQISQLSTFQDLPGKFLAGSRRGITMSTNNGSNWVLQSNTGLAQNPDGTKPAKAIYYMNDILFAGGIGTVYRSTDFGNNFTATNFQLGTQWDYFTSMVSVGNKLIAGISRSLNSPSPAIIMTTDDGDSWTSIQDNGFPGKSVSAMVVSDDYLIAGTSQNGIWIRPLEKFNLNLINNFEAFFSQDTVTIELRNSVSPYNLVETKKGLGGQGVSQQFSFLNAANGTPYYIVVKHRNSITTWSSAPHVFTNNTLNFDFTSSVKQAYGNNETEVDGKWSFYSGDVNSDGVIDLSDLTLIYNQAQNFSTGYINEDLNYDGLVDLTDILFGFNNSTKFVTEAHP